MKGKLVLVIATNSNSTSLATPQTPEMTAFVPWQIDGSRLINNGLGCNNE
jgi:hypothetical protein